MVNIDYLYDPEVARPFCGKDYFVDKKLGFQVIEHGTILPCKKTIDGKTPQHAWAFGGIVDSEGNCIQSSAVFNGSVAFYTPPQNQFNTALKL